VSDLLAGQLRALVRLEKARALLVGAWGFADSNSGSTALLYGPPGAGKRTAAEAVASELGKPLKLIHFGELCARRSGGSGRGGGGGSSVSGVFREAALGDALLLIEGVEAVVGADEEDRRTLKVLLFEMRRFHGVVLLSVAAYKPYDSVVHSLSPLLLAATKMVLEFTLPDRHGRARLWERLLPPRCPLASRLDFDALADASRDMSATQIANCLYQAAAAVALPSEEADAERALSMDALMRVAAAERAKWEGSRRYIEQSMLI